jgi:hypothetical protein
VLDDIHTIYENSTPVILSDTKTKANFMFECIYRVIFKLYKQDSIYLLRSSKILDYFNNYLSKFTKDDDFRVTMTTVIVQQCKRTITYLNEYDGDIFKLTMFNSDFRKRCSSLYRTVEEVVKLCNIEWNFVNEHADINCKFVYQLLNVLSVECPVKITRLSRNMIDFFDIDKYRDPNNIIFMTVDDENVYHSQATTIARLSTILLSESTLQCVSEQDINPNADTDCFVELRSALPLYDVMSLRCMLSIMKLYQENKTRVFVFSNRQLIKNTINLRDIAVHEFITGNTNLFHKYIHMTAVKPCSPESAIHTWVNVQYIDTDELESVIKIN